MLSCRRSAAIALAATAASVLIPWTADDVERNAALDIELVRSGKVEYKGIEATFEELSRAYALAISSEAEFLGWSAIPNPTHPEAEALVSCRFPRRRSDRRYFARRRGRPAGGAPRGPARRHPGA